MRVCTKMTILNDWFIHEKLIVAMFTTKKKLKINHVIS